MSVASGRRNRFVVQVARIFVVGSLAATLVAALPATRTGVAHAQGSSTGVVVARLVAYPVRGSACGRVHTVVLMQYDTVRVVSGRAPSPRFWTAVSCPDLHHHVSFVPGALHQLTVRFRRPNLWPVPISFRSAPTSYTWATEVRASPP